MAIAAYVLFTAILIWLIDYYLTNTMQNLNEVITNKKIKTQKQFNKFLIGKTVRIIAKRNPNNSGSIGDTFVVEKVANINIDGKNSHDQLKDYCNKIYFTDIEICPIKNKSQLLDIMQDASLTSLEQYNLVQNIFKY